MEAPIAICAYDRAALLERTLAALERCDGFAGRRAHLFCDAPRDATAEPGVAETLGLARAWCRRVGARLSVRAENRGIANIPEAIAELCQSEGAAVSVEDDHLAAPAFLTFVDRALTRYADDERVFQVSAYRIGERWDGGPDTFFLTMPMPMGLATWRRAWQRFQWDVPGAAALLADAEARRRFDFGGDYPAAALLERTLSGAFESYFIRWYFTVFTAGGLSLTPCCSLMRNIGLDSGLHGDIATAGADESFFNGAWCADADPAQWSFPQETAVDGGAEARIRAVLSARKARRRARP